MADAPPSPSRPRRLPDDLQVGLHLTLERFLSTGPYRTYYLANNLAPRWYTRICWTCGHKHNPTTAESCGYCQTPLRPRRFLLSARWGGDVRPFHAFAALRLKHAALNSPVVLYQLEGQVLAVHELGDEALLSDEPCPLHPRTLLTAAYALAGGMHHLHRHGVVLDGLGPHHVLVHRDRARLFDPDVREVRSRPVPAGDPAARRDVCDLARMLLGVTPLEQTVIRDFFAEATEDVFPGSLAFQRELRAFARDLRIVAPDRSQAVMSVVGRKRSHNEDAWAWRRLPQADVHVIADGMGGYAAGDVASRTAVETVLEELTSRLPDKPLADEAFEALMNDVTAIASRAIRVQGTEGPTGTTLVVAIVWPGRVVQVAHIGDSRAYLVTDAGLRPLTEDHSMVAAMVASGKIDRETARTHPRANVLLQFLGSGTTPEPDVLTHRGKPGERLLLCTDGLWGELPETVLAEHLQGSTGPRRQLRNVVSAALEAGGTDNVTALMIAL
jgi:protein phosphatase